MSTEKKTSANPILIDEEPESTAQVLHQTEDQEDADSLAEFKKEFVASLRDDQEKLRQTLVEDFGVPPESAADLVVSMADMCAEFSHFIVKVGSYQEDETPLELNQLFHNFFNHRGYGLTDGHSILSYIPQPWSTRFLNEFLLNTVTSEIPFVYLVGEKVEALALPDGAFWMDFKASLEATGDWDCLQTHSNKNLSARSMLAHAAKSALGCLLGRLEVSYPAHALDILFKYIDTPRLLDMFLWPYHYLEDDELEFCEPEAADDYEWVDFLGELASEVGPESLTLHSKHQVDEFMSVFKDFKGNFTGYEIDQHGILRYQAFQGWPAYVRYKFRYPSPAGEAGNSIH
jgi:hypothetical protein